MKGKIISGLTPQQKMVAVNNKFGNTNIASQQGTTRVLFDSIKLDGQTELRFFENSGSKRYPFTNIGAEGNRLNVGDTFAIEKIYFAVAYVDPDTNAITQWQNGINPIPQIHNGEWSFQIANSQVIKQLPLTPFVFAGYNPTAVNDQDVAFETFTDIIIPPLLEYILSVRLANSYVPAELNFNYVYCFIEGPAGIIAPQTTF